MGFIDVVKSIGGAQGLALPSTEQVREYGSVAPFEKSKTWSMVDNAYRGLKEAGHDGDYAAFLDTYATLPWVYIGSWVIATSASGCRLAFFEGNKKEKKEIDSGVISELFDSPNEWDDITEMLELTYINLELTGQAYWEKTGIYNNLPVKLYNLNPAWMKVIPDARTKIGGYRFDMGTGPTVTYGPEEIAHFKYANPCSQFYGQGTIKALQLTLVTELNMESYNRSFFENEARPDVVITHTPDAAKGIRPLLKEDRDELALRWKQAFAGPRNARRPVVLSSGMNVELLTTERQDMGYVEMGHSLRENILGAMGVPPVMVGLFEFANYANSKEQIRIFWTCTMPPKFRRVEGTINKQIAKPFQKDVTCKFMTDDIAALAEDPKDMEERLTKRFDRGIISYDEYREGLGMGKMEGEYGKRRVMVGNYVPIEDVFAPAPDEDNQQGEENNQQVGF